MFFNRFRKRKWNQAHQAEPNFYRRGNEILGVFALTEDTDTVYPISPSMKVEGQVVTIWEILFVPLGEEPPLGSARYETVIRLLKQYGETEQKGGFLYVAGINKSTMMEIYHKAVAD